MGTFGSFQLPFEEDWEACSRGGRDRKEDDFGIPLCDVDQRPILVKAEEDFGSLSSLGANFNGDYPAGQATKGPNRNGTVPVDQYPANGFGCVDQHGQVWEWTQNENEGLRRDASELLVDSGIARSLCGGAWNNNAETTAAEIRNRLDPAIHINFVGVRVSRTP